MKLWRTRKVQLNEEIASHLEMARQDRIERGESAKKAEQDSRREFGNVALVEHVTRDQWGWLWLEDFFLDLRFAARTLRKNPGFTAVAILTLALGIGANTSLFSIVNGVLLNPLPYPDADQLVTIHESKPNFKNGSISYPNFRDWQKDNKTFTSMAIARGYAYSLTGRGEPEQILAQFISSDFFSMLGVQPVLGRTFAPGEDVIGGPPIALIGAGLWKRKFGASPAILGQTLALDGKDFTIVGVIPASFDVFLRSANLTEIYVPIGQWNNPFLNRRGAGLGIHGIGRLKPGVAFDQAVADMDRVSRNLTAAYPDTNANISASLVPLRQDMLGDVQPTLLVLFGAVGFVLLIACGNVANLLLARSTGRTREFAIRAALGAGHSRLVRQLLTESILLALAGGGLGILLAHWATAATLKFLPQQLPRAADIKLDSHVLLFSLGISLLAGITFGLAPALKAATPRLHDTLKETGRGSSGNRQRAQSVFVVLEMAMALILLVGAGLLIRSLASLWNVDPGFKPDNIATFGLAFPPAILKSSPSPEAIRAYLREIDDKFAATATVQAVSQSWGAVPLSGEDDRTFWIDGEPKPANETDMRWTLNYIVGPGYLHVMGIPLLKGRFFNSHDDNHAPLVAVVDDVFARKYFGDANPIGKVLRLNTLTLSGDGTPAEIVGVVGHVNQWGLDSDATQSLRAQLYLACLQMSDDYIANVPSGGGTFMMVRSQAPFTSLMPLLNRTNREINPEQVLYQPQTMDSIVAATLAARRFSMILFSSFAALALVLSSVGIYGVISYLVGQRTQEIGIRVALGARHADVLKLVIGHGARMAFIGIAVGVLASLALTRLMSSMLYAVSPFDPLTFAAVAVILSLVAIAACYIPARRAMRVDPTVALRYE